VQCGVRNLAISEAAAPFGLYYAPDPSSQIACTIGGNVAENSGGVHCLKYGLTLHNVLRVRGFTVEGDAVEFGSEALDVPGLDLLPLIVGSEGMLAVITEVTVKLVPKPLLARCIMASFDDIRKAGDAVAAVIAAGIIPAGLEMMDKPMTAAVEDYVHAGYDLDGRGHPAVRKRWHARRGGRRDRPHAGRADRLRRHARGGQQGRGPAPEVLERAQERLPGQRAASAPTTCAWTAPSRASAWPTSCWPSAMEKKYGLRCCNVFHAGDGNLHPLILFDANDPDQLHRCELFGADILETSVAMGGTVTGEHGVGIEKLSSMCVQFSPEEREQIFAVKRAFDAGETLNPGKVIPTLHRCAEYGRMHVKKGLLPFPELERF
jgi:glycolate oxidase